MRKWLGYRKICDFGESCWKVLCVQGYGFMYIYIR